MAIQEKKRNARSAALILDLMHIIIGILVVICAALAFLNPEKNQILFPVIFCLAALLNGLNGRYRLLSGGRNKKVVLAGIAQCITGGFLLIIGIISLISIWK